MNFRSINHAAGPNSNSRGNNNSDDNQGMENSGASRSTTIRLAILMKGPRTLKLLWDEYEFEFNGNKPEKHFTSVERGRVKQVFSFRLFFWKAMEKLIARGNSVQSAIEKLYDAFGNELSVSNLIREIKKDKQLTKVQ
ncbi:hypothetical protein SARC_10465 [Sphaeroforma arctica JP610]|uniref:Transcription activator GCR1-like domain-containing protein n=1 Tax=Sphaeroforma arctica JP610 TaxID=667725 RepID=A0A0L0FJZ6_9EUKA|nr:hypothetical protein SARC_10465 [Sphaeroforma arctica JP610]KNC77060.1 hypothetical protein SARC_10465 [Sphaeroforma arctica JP610]|eukprot:XP_014150962.1 hypothetical protein SARC_10465 [Sphaeroforma arctica JP610]